MTAKTSLKTPLANVRGLGAARSGTKHFWHQRLTALANVPLTIAFILIILALNGSTYPSSRCCCCSSLARGSTI
jgi:succinate dehydrogenase / fumarate reductase, membrane anchor subunit